MTNSGLIIGPRSIKVLRTWLIATAISVVATLIVGGATRLTESGLSITEWRPVTGVIPPVSDESWRLAYQQYQQIPEAQTALAAAEQTLAARQQRKQAEQFHVRTPAPSA